MQYISQDSLNLWVNAFQSQSQVIYAFTETTAQELSYGTLLLGAGDSLQMRRITCKMLRNDNQLAREVYGLAHAGLLGFANAQNHHHVQFRADIAEKLGESRTFKVINAAKPDQMEEMNIEIDSLDDAAYMAMVSIPEEIGLEKDREDKDGDERRFLQKESTSQSSPLASLNGVILGRTGSQRNRGDVSRRQEELETQEERILEERMKKKSEFKKEIKRIKDDSAELKREIKNEDIRGVEKRQSKKLKYS